MDNDDEFDFSDDGLDDLPANTLRELEFSAIRATQHVSAEAHTGGSDYGLDDEDEVINLDDQTIAPQASAWANAGGPQYAQDARRPHDRYHNASINDGEVVRAMEMDGLPQRSQADPNQLLVRLKQAEQSKARAVRDANSAQSNAQRSAGEALTLRRKLETVNRERDQREQAIAQSHNEAMTKLKAEIEKLRKDAERVHTDNQFLRHDRVQAAEEARRKKGHQVSLKSKENEAATAAGTPRKKERGLPLRDGFDDDDVVMASPTKAKTATPKQAGKRKRQVVDQSPIPLPALQLSEPRERSKAQEPSIPLEQLDATFLESTRRKDHRFELLHRLVNNRSSNGTDRVLEALTQHVLPSQPERKLSSIVYDELAGCNLEQSACSLAVKICDIFLSLWEECLDELYYEPMYLILDALQYILASEPGSAARAITERAVPTIDKTIGLVSIPMSKATIYEDASGLYSPEQLKISASIDVLDCLDLLYTLACACVTSSDAIRRFWELLRQDFPLALIRWGQPLPEIIMALRILSTSCLPDTIGTIVSNKSETSHQEKREGELIERLTNMLSEIPCGVPHPLDSTKRDEYPSEQVLHVRIHILALLTNFSISTHGLARLAKNKWCIGRLINFLHLHLNALYAHPCAPTQDLITTAINFTVKLAHALITWLVPHMQSLNPKLDASDIVKDKLRVIQGGPQKYFVTLARLAFRDGIVLDKGVDAEAEDLAHRLLDEWVTKGEGEECVAVFDSQRSA